MKLAKRKTRSKETEKRYSVLVTVRPRLENPFSSFFSFFFSRLALTAFTDTSVS